MVTQGQIKAKEGGIFEGVYRRSESLSGGKTTRYRHERPGVNLQKGGGGRGVTGGTSAISLHYQKGRRGGRKLGRRGSYQTGKPIAEKLDVEADLGDHIKSSRDKKDPLASSTLL